MSGRESAQLNERYDGRAKVTGTAKYAMEFAVPERSTPSSSRARFRMAALRRSAGVAAERAYGVLAVITPFNAPRLPDIRADAPGHHSLSILQDTEVHYNASRSPSWSQRVSTARGRQRPCSGSPTTPSPRSSISWGGLGSASDQATRP